MQNLGLALCLGLAVVGCTDDGGGGGGDGTGEDTLPKRGERAQDPTIVSATARCSCGADTCPGGTPPNHVRVRVDASDPMGPTNLGTCAVTLAGRSDQGTFSDGNGNGTCSTHVLPAMPCAVGQVHTVGITISNDTAGVTQASVKLTVAM